jgi:hypothetical protein
MSPFGKLVTAGIALVAGSSLLTGVTTAYMLRPSTSSTEPTASTAYAAPAPRAMTLAPRPVTRAASPATWEAPRPTRVSTVAPNDCATGRDRAVSIAKPGALGGLLGAGLGAAGGAIANGGKGAGQGALIGGLTGVAVGAGYGAYKVKNECGTVFGSRN